MRKISIRKGDDISLRYLFILFRYMLYIRERAEEEK